MENPIHIQLEPRQIIYLQMDGFLQFFDPANIPKRALASHCGKAIITLNYDTTSIHPILLPELRKFLRTLARRWGTDSAPFFCEPYTQFMALYCAAQLETIQITEYVADGKIIVRHHRAELIALNLTLLAAIQEMGTRAGMTMTAIENRQEKFSRFLSSTFLNELHIQGFAK